MKHLIRYAYKVPELLSRALAGDATAIAILAVMGIAVAGTAIKEEIDKQKKKEN